MFSQNRVYTSSWGAEDLHFPVLMIWQLKGKGCVETHAHVFRLYIVLNIKTQVQAFVPPQKSNLKHNYS